MYHVAGKQKLIGKKIQGMYRTITYIAVYLFIVNFSNISNL